MQLRFIDRRLADDQAAHDLTRSIYSGTQSLPDGMPLILDDRFRPVEPWFTYFRIVGASVSTKTVREYGYDAFRFARFLESRRTDVVHASQEDIVAYRNSRLVDATEPVGHATWQRDTVVIRGMYQLLKQLGQVTRDPWITIGRSSALGRVWRSEPDIRPLTQEQWIAFRDIGLAGQGPDGRLDHAWRGRTPQRGVAGGQVAITSGMRVCEFSTLLDLELPEAEGSRGSSVLLEACAKYQKRRRVHVPAAALRAVDRYRRTERRAVVRASALSLWRRRSELFVVEEFDASSGVVRGNFNGVRSRWAVHLMPPHLRRIAVTEIEGGMEALGLFIGRGGLPISLRAWHNTFELASRRVLNADIDHLRGRRSRVTPHDLRHTYAVVILKALTDVAVAREADRRAGNLGPATLSEHISINPLLRVQRLLGHADPSTTMVYLRYIEDTDALVQDAFDSWNDVGLTYADEVLNSRDAR